MPDERHRAVWRRTGPTDHELVSTSGERLGRYWSYLPDISTARATIGGVTLVVEGTGTIRRSLTARRAQDPDPTGSDEGEVPRGEVRFPARRSGSPPGGQSGPPVAALHVSTLSWHGEVEVGSGEDAHGSTGATTWALRREPTLNLKWTIGPAANPLLTTEVRSRHVHLDTSATLLSDHPAVLALTMYLMQHHRSGSTTR
ncbi:hypothetical protein [Euzebya tangerina]|uniref:hypothetical protein n=1 Tax=Euzebya tangerina TaxID=591198 RepID=UPI000E31CE99|nr:hypothetical protein [Euzebya tangerina]